MANFNYGSVSNADLTSVKSPYNGDVPFKTEDLDKLLDKTSIDGIIRALELRSFARKGNLVWVNNENANEQDFTKGEAFSWYSDIYSDVWEPLVDIHVAADGTLTVTHARDIEIPLSEMFTDNEGDMKQEYLNSIRFSISGEKYEHNPVFILYPKEDSK